MSGEKGKRGFSGAEGRKGDVGPLGARGMAGMKGEKGEGRIACGAVEFNWKQCVWTNYDQRDNGTVQVRPACDHCVHVDSCLSIAALSSFPDV